jgi:hypothetical protein
LRLRLLAHAAGGDRVQGLDQELAAERREPVMEASRGFPLADPYFAGREQGARVEAGFHAHDRHAGGRVPREQRALNGRRAAPARQQRCMNVETAEFRQGKHGRRQNQAIRHHHQRIQLQAVEGGSSVRRFETGRLEHRKSGVEGAPFHSAYLQGLAPARRAVRLREDGDHTVPRAQ